MVQVKTNHIEPAVLAARALHLWSGSARTRPPRVCVSLILFFGLTAGAVRGQTVTPDSILPWLMPVPGSRAEGYVRSLEVAGLTHARGIAVRDGFEQWVGTEASGRSEAGPWARVYGAVPSDATWWGLLPARMTTAYNSAFPYQRGGGPVWYGRGFTSVVEAGIHLRLGPFRAVMNPLLFRAANASFDLAPTGGSEGDLELRSPLDPARLDAPQRFGFGPYQRLGLGAAALRFDAVGLSLGLSAGPQKWGPGDLHPMILGDAAGGVPHAMIGTQRPVPVFIGLLSARYMAGRTTQSDWFQQEAAAHERLLNGFVISLQPRGLAGLEVGASRLFHSEWPEGGADMKTLLLRPFEGFLKGQLSGVDQRVDEQYASLFFRWLPGSSSFEIFGEYMRVDHSWDARIAVLEPDDQSAYMLGLRKVLGRQPQRLTTLRAETIVSGSTHRERGGARVEAAYRSRPVYWDARRIGGLTHRGLLLTTTAGAYANAQSLGLDRYSPEGRLTLEVDRSVVRDETLGVVPDEPAGPDVLYAFTGELSRFVGAWDLEVSSSWILNLNRYLTRDASSVRFRLMVSRRFVRPSL